VKRLLLIGGHLDKGYHIFFNNYFMSVPFVCHLHQLSIYKTGIVRRNRKLYPSSSRTNLQLDRKYTADLVPFLRVFSVRTAHKKNPVICLSSHDTAEEEGVQGTHGGNPIVKTCLVSFIINVLFFPEIYLL
jgi:hypothetical protein